MNVKPLLFAIVGAVVALFYALESFLSFRANGFTAPLLVKLVICAIGAYFFWRNLGRIRKSNRDSSPTLNSE